MSPHYKHVVPSYCSGLDWVEQAFEVTQVGHGEGDVVQAEVEELKQQVGLLEASTLVRCCPIGNIEVDMAGKEA